MTTTNANRMHVKSLFDLIRTHIPNPQRGVEVGVWKGDTSAALLREFPGCHMLCVDSWRAWPKGSVYYDKHKKMGRMSQAEWDAIFEEALTNLSRTNGLFSMSSMLSADAAAMVVDESRDFVFLDASHEYNDVKRDIELWSPKVRDGGLIMGHDYGSRMDKLGLWGVSKAVHEVFGQDRVIVRRGNVWAVIKRNPIPLGGD